MLLPLRQLECFTSERGQSFYDDSSRDSDIQHGQATGNYLYHDDGSLKKDVQEEIDYIDWYPNGLVKRIYRTSSSTQSDLYFEYDPTGNRALKVEITRTGTTINAAEDWIYTYYAADANGITMAVYDLNPDDVDPAVLAKNETMIYGGSRLGMETTTIPVNTAVDYINDCNNDGLASGIVQLGAFTPSNGVVLEIMLNTDVIADITWNTSNTIQDHGQALVNEINAGAEGYYAEIIDMSSYVFIRLKEIIGGSLQNVDLSVELDDIAAPTYVKREPTIGECEENRILGNKFYELANYLGNVNEVISDRKIAHDDPLSTNVDYYEADVISYADYYPFGMEMPGRGGMIAGGDYRYAYNGMEKDPEVSGNGNSYTTQFRQYDPRLGRWKSLDPLAGKFPDQSPFNAFNSNPIYFKDPLGLESEGVDPAGSESNPHHVSSIDEAKTILDEKAKNGDIDSQYFTSGDGTQYMAKYNQGSWEISRKKSGSNHWINNGLKHSYKGKPNVSGRAGTSTSTNTDVTGKTNTNTVPVEKFDTSTGTDRLERNDEIPAGWVRHDKVGFNVLGSGSLVVGGPYSNTYSISVWAITGSQSTHSGHLLIIASKSEGWKTTGAAIEVGFYGLYAGGEINMVNGPYSDLRSLIEGATSVSETYSVGTPWDFVSLDYIYEEGKLNGNLIYELYGFGFSGGGSANPFPVSYTEMTSTSTKVWVYPAITKMDSIRVQEDQKLWEMQHIPIIESNE